MWIPSSSSTQGKHQKEHSGSPAAFYLRGAPSNSLALTTSMIPLQLVLLTGVSAAVLSNPEIKDKRKQKKNQRLKTQTSRYFLFSFTSNFCLALQKKRKKRRWGGVLTAQQQHHTDPRNAGEAQQRPWTSTKMSRVGAQQPPILSKPLSTL